MAIKPPAQAKIKEGLEKILPGAKLKEIKNTAGDQLMIISAHADILSGPDILILAEVVSLVPHSLKITRSGTGLCLSFQ